MLRKYTFTALNSLHILRSSFLPIYHLPPLPELFLSPFPFHLPSLLSLLSLLLLLPSPLADVLGAVTVVVVVETPVVVVVVSGESREDELADVSREVEGSMRSVFNTSVVDTAGRVGGGVGPACPFSPNS